MPLFNAIKRLNSHDLTISPNHLFFRVLLLFFYRQSAFEIPLRRRFNDLPISLLNESIRFDIPQNHLFFCHLVSASPAASHLPLLFLWLVPRLCCPLSLFLFLCLFILYSEKKVADRDKLKVLIDSLFSGSCSLSLYRLYCGLSSPFFDSDCYCYFDSYCLTSYWISCQRSYCYWNF